MMTCSQLNDSSYMLCCFERQIGHTREKRGILNVVKESVEHVITACRKEKREIGSNSSWSAVEICQSLMREKY